MARIATSLRIEPPQLQTLTQRLKDWRAGCAPGERIPEELWQAAVELARFHGLSRTATALKLSYYGLQRRLSAGTPGQGRSTAAAFVELLAPPTGCHPKEGTLEVVRGSGARLIVRLPHSTPRELLPLVELFLRHGL
jgi:hypothetical protein